MHIGGDRTIKHVWLWRREVEEKDEYSSKIGGKGERRWGRTLLVSLL